MAKGDRGGDPKISGSDGRTGEMPAEPTEATKWTGSDEAAEPRGFARLARGRAAVPLLALLSFTDACVSPIVPEVVLVPMVLARPEQRWRFAFLVSLMSVLGGICGYLIGRLAWGSGLDQFFYEYVPGFSAEGFAAASQEFGDRTFWVTFMAGFTPLPYKLFTVTAGAFHEQVDFGAFVLASALSRSLRFYLTIWLLHALGRRVIERYSRLFSFWFFVVLAVVVALAIFL